MTEDEHQRVIDELETVIRDTSALMERFEASGMDEAMAGDYAQLHDLYSRAVSDQKAHTLAMLKIHPSATPSTPISRFQSLP